MYETLGEIKDNLKALLAGLDSDCLAGAEAARMVLDFAAIERLAAAGKLLCLRRVEATGSWQGQGDRTPAAWLARHTGTTVGAGADQVETAKRTRNLPNTEKALRDGDLSPAQASQVAAGAEADPNAEDRLLDTAKKEGVAAVRDEANRVRAAARANEGIHHERIRRERHLRKWTDRDGAGRIDGKFTPEALAAIWDALGPFRAQVFRDARRSGTRDNYDAYTADALEAMAMASTGHHAATAPTDPHPHRATPTPSNAPRSTEAAAASTGSADATCGAAVGDDSDDLDLFGGHDLGPFPDRSGPDPGEPSGGSGPPTTGEPPGAPPGGPKRRPRATIHIRVDHAAWNRGFTKPGEVCEIPGFGPIPVATAYEYATDAVLWALVTDGVDVTHVANATRTLTAAQRAALTERDRGCPVPGCPATTFLEAHHLIPWRPDHGPTELWNMGLPCPHHHDLITYHGYRLDRHPDGTWTWHTPDDIPDRPPASPPPHPTSPGHSALELRLDEPDPTASGTGPSANDEEVAA